MSGYGERVGVSWVSDDHHTDIAVGKIVDGLPLSGEDLCVIL